MAMANSALSRRRLVIAGALTLTVLLLWSLRPGPPDYSDSWQSAKDSISGFVPTKKPKDSVGILPHVESYFDQVFSHDHPKPFAYTHLKDACNNAPWNNEQIYLKCGGMAAGMFSIVSQVKVCLKMAVETGSSIVLPAMPLRASDDLTNFNFLNGTAYLNYDQWFDTDHLREQMGKACPKMKIVHPDELINKSVKVKDFWSISCGDAFGYQKIKSYFWAGRPFKTFFDTQLKALRFKANADPEYDKTKTGITVIDIDAEFLLFRITDDPTRRELRYWNDLSHVVRFKDEPRQIIHRLLDGIGSRSYYGVHFRVEKDSIWSDLNSQLTRDLDALDQAWEADGRPERPLVYLACGDQEQVEKFVSAGKERGWEVTHKWKLSKDDAKATQMINDLPFDFQGAIDMGIMVRSNFFFGVTGSAFSSYVANQRDVTGRYRGSSFTIMDDEGARTHLFNDMDADEYACCL